MSAIDARLSSGQRTAFVEEVRSSLPAFLSTASREIVDPIQDVAALLQLRRQDLRKVIQHHLLLSAEVSAFVEGLSGYLRSPSTTSVRPRIETRVIRGQVDWGATIRTRASRGADVTFITRPASRIFDTDENRALVWLVGQLLGYQHGARDAMTAVANRTPWEQRLEHHRSALQLAERTQWARSVSHPQRLDVDMRRALAHSRRHFLRKTSGDLVRLIDRSLQSPTPEGVLELLSRRYFEPSQDWRLYELVVVLRVATAFREVALRSHRTRLLVGSGSGPFVSFVMDDETTVEIWYQAWPSRTASVQSNVLARHEVSGAGSRPDIVATRLAADGQLIDAVLLELKASEHPSTLADGVLQTLGYLADRASLLLNPPAGWVVPLGGARTVDPQPSHPVWIVDCDRVARSLVERFAAT